MGERFRSRDQTHPECGSNLVKTLLQIQGLLLVRISEFASKFG